MANGEKPVTYTKPGIDVQIPERAILAKLLCEQSNNLSDHDPYVRRVTIENLMIKLSNVKETPRPET